DYSRHLGLIARARLDFGKLSELLAATRAEAGGAPDAVPSLPRVDRIILYIDDLDRCPEDKVVDVLQAVHLLLAFPLFVVVVGVDSRWLLHSLRQRSKAFAGQNGAEAGLSAEEIAEWRTTPLNYLEKIFQIPFTLRPMAQTGFGKLIEDLTAPATLRVEPPARERAASGAIADEPRVETPAATPSQPSPAAPPQ